MKKLLIPVVLLMLTTLACTKKNEPSNPVGTTKFKTYASMDEVFSMLEQKPKVMIFDAGTVTSFYGSNGVRYTFRPNSFADEAGALVTGNVQVEVTEYPKKGDMIFSGVLPISDGMPLVSGGEIYVNATKNGQQLSMRPGMTFIASIPQFGSKDTVMNLFTGDTNGGTSTNKVNWQITKGDSASGTIVYKGDTIRILCDSLKFWNCDHFMNSSNLQKFKVAIVASGFDNSAISALFSYAIFDAQNGVMPLSSLASGIYSVSNIPKAAVHFVSFCLINGHFYAGVSLANPATTGSTYTITLTEVDPNDFKAQINGLY